MKVQVQGAWEEFNLRLDVYLKGVGLRAAEAGKQTPVLVPLFCEDELVPIGLDERAPEVDAKLFSQYNSCRNSANSQLSKGRQCLSEHVLQYLSYYEDVLCMVDSSFRVEAEWMRHMAAVGCRDLLQKHLLAELPEEGKWKDPKEVANAVERLKNTTVFMFAGRDSQSKWNVVAEWANAVANGRKPSFLAVKACPFLKQVQGRMKYMLRVVTKATAERSPTELLAEAAVEQIIVDLEAKVGKAEPVQLADLQVLDTFGWLLSKPQMEEHSLWVKSALSLSLIHI